MFEAEKYPTHLGGESANLDVIDLDPLELVRATVSSRVKARVYLGVAEAQAKAASELGDSVEERAYLDTAHTLSRFAEKHPRRIQR